MANTDPEMAERIAREEEEVRRMYDVPGAAQWEREYAATWANVDEDRNDFNVDAMRYLMMGTLDPRPRTATEIQIEQEARSRELEAFRRECRSLPYGQIEIVNNPIHEELMRQINESLEAHPQDIIGWALEDIQVDENGQGTARILVAEDKTGSGMKGKIKTKDITIGTPVYLPRRYRDKDKKIKYRSTQYMVCGVETYDGSIDGTMASTSVVMRVTLEREPGGPKITKNIPYDDADTITDFFKTQKGCMKACNVMNGEEDHERMTKGTNRFFDILWE